MAQWSLPKEALVRLTDPVFALLFASETPSSPEALASALEAPLFEVEEALESLGRRLAESGPLQLVRIAGGYQISTKPEYAGIVARHLDPQPARLSRSVMETLAVVAYQQPVTSADIDSVRGVQSDYSLKQLVEKKLVMEVGRKHAPGRPMLYATTAQFLHMFNLNSLADLPHLSTVQGDILSIGSNEDPNQPALDFTGGE